LGAVSNGERLVKAGRRVEAGADRGAALRELVEARQHAFDPGDAVADLRGVAGKFLAERQRGRVLQMGAADLDDAVPGLRLRIEPGVDLLERRQQPFVHRARGGDVHRRRKAVVGRLAFVDMVVGMDRALAALLAGEDLVGARGDHLIGVHVRLRARAGLPDHQRELVVVPARGDFAGSLLDRLGEFGVDVAEPRIDPRRRLLDEAERVDDLDRHLLALAEREIVDRALRLRAPISIAGDLDRSEAVGLGAGGGDRIHGSSYPLALRALSARPYPRRLGDFQAAAICLLMMCGV
jgi:hypothetical protein